MDGVRKSRVQRPPRGLVRGTMSLVLVLWCAALLDAQHGHDWSWMGACCGERDCVHVPVAVLDQQAGVVMIRDQVATVHPSKIQRSQDGRSYWCMYQGVNPWQDRPTDQTVRCVFYTEGV